MDSLLAQVRELYMRNRQTGHAEWCDLDFDFVCPSPTTYPFQWFWDSCFHAIVLSHFDLARARQEISQLLSQAQPDGFIPHVIFWDLDPHQDRLTAYNIAHRTPYLSDHIQPPVLAEAIRAVVDRGGGEPGWLDQVLAKASAFFDWLDAVRDPDQDGLIAILQPDESGLDHSPKYDAYLRLAAGASELTDFDRAWRDVTEQYTAVNRDQAAMFNADVFLCEDVLVNSIYGRNLAVLAELLESRGNHEAALRMTERSARGRAALLTKCFDPETGLFFDLAGHAETQLRVSTISSLMPLILDDLPREHVRALAAHLEDSSAYAARFPVPSVSLSEPAFRPGSVGDRLLWRGPAWMNTNWYLFHGLRRHGCSELAGRIASASLELVRRTGFREYYNPLTGEGLGAPDFSWSALVLDMVD